MLRILKLNVVLAAFSLLMVGCSPSVCSGTSCACPNGETCAFDTCSANTAGCNFNCSAGSTCTGTCGANCNVACYGTKCTHTVGANANVSCISGSCDVTCTGACSATGAGLKLTCKSGNTTAAGCGS